MNIERGMTMSKENLTNTVAVLTVLLFLVSSIGLVSINEEEQDAKISMEVESPFFVIDTEPQGRADSIHEAIASNALAQWDSEVLTTSDNILGKVVVGNFIEGNAGVELVVGTWNTSTKKAGFRY